MMNSESVKTGSGLDSRGGFTMIELMVVVTIIIILASLIMVGLSKAMKN